MTKEEDPVPIGRPPIEGHYANVFEVGYNAFEFVIDFGQQYDDQVHAWFHTRIITSAAHVEALSDVLRDSITQHRACYPAPENPDP